MGLHPRRSVPLSGSGPSPHEWRDERPPAPPAGRCHPAAPRGHREEGDRVEPARPQGGQGHRRVFDRQRMVA
eukprot:3320906-Pyramimonas_sp.AAC.1